MIRAWKAGMVAAVWLLVALGCAEENRVPRDSGPSDGIVIDDARPDGEHSDGVLGDGQSSDGAPSDAAPSDSAPSDIWGPDACVSSCSVLFSYPAGAEGAVALWGSFDNWVSGMPMQKVGSEWQVSVDLAHASRVAYKFVLDNTTWVADPNNGDTDGPPDYNSVLEVSCPGGCTPQGFDWRDAVMYFVMLDRFKNGDTSNDGPVSGVKEIANWQGGDLQGLIDTLKSGYFDELGINALWITSPTDAPDGYYTGNWNEVYTGYHGYWPTDLTKVEERLGDMAKLKELVDEAHARGIKVLIDYVMNHVHSTSPTYQQHDDWFWPLDNCLCGGGCSWDPPDGLRCWFTDYLPDFDFTKVDARNFSVQNAIQWIKDTGVDGFRLDAVKHIEMSWLTDLRAEVNTLLPGTHFYMVGETFTDSKGLLKDYIDPATKLDGQFDFPLRATLARTILNREGSLRELEGMLADNETFYAPGTLMGNFIGNHDLPRSIHLAEDTPRWSNWEGGGGPGAFDNPPPQPDYERPYQRLAVAYAVLMTLPGVPLVYYGDEVAMAGAGDPDNRRFMQWSGYNTHQLWLKERLKKLIEVRMAHPALRRGVRQERWLGDDVYAYSMTEGADQVFVVINRSDSSQSVTLPAGTYDDLVSGGQLAGASLSVPPREALILQPR